MKLVFCLICFLSMSSFGYSTELEQLEFNSQASQDEFVYFLLYDMLDKQDTGHYLEIGAGEPQLINNSYFFEKQLNWDGVSIDISDGLRDRWYADRSNTLLIEDATKSNYRSILKSFPRVIDYLSLDVDSVYDVVLKRIPFDEHIFKVITIEHDFYRYGDLYRSKERTILASFGYHLLCSDVSNDGFSFEDWWIHPSQFPPEVFSALKALDLKSKDHRELIRTMLTIQ